MTFEGKSGVAEHIGNTGKREPLEESIGFDFTRLESFSNLGIQQHPVRFFGQLNQFENQPKICR